MPSLDENPAAFFLTPSDRERLCLFQPILEDEPTMILGHLSKLRLLRL